MCSVSRVSHSSSPTWWWRVTASGSTPSSSRYDRRMLNATVASVTSSASESRLVVPSVRQTGSQVPTLDCDNLGTDDGGVPLPSRDARRKGKQPTGTRIVWWSVLSSEGGETGTEEYKHSDDDAEAGTGVTRGRLGGRCLIRNRRPVGIRCSADSRDPLRAWGRRCGGRSLRRGRRPSGWRPAGRRRCIRRCLFRGRRLSNRPATATTTAAVGRRRRGCSRRRRRRRGSG